MMITARLFGSGARAVGETSLRLHATLVDPALLAAAFLDPGGAAHFAATLLTALDGPSGLTELAAHCAATDLALRSAAVGYSSVDQLNARTMPTLQAAFALPGALGDLAVDAARGRPGDGLDTFITDDPQLTGLAAAGLESITPTADAGAAYPDGRAHVAPVTSRSTAPPRTLADMMGGLARLTDDRTDGEVDVQIITARDRSGALVRRVVVDIPGTGDWDLARRTDHDVTNMGTSLRALSGETTTCEAGVLAAMRSAGVRPTDEVLLVGHSQGGLIAVNAARDAVASGEFNVTHVITAGAPISGIVGALPATVAVLALENRGDIVPDTDGGPNPDRPNVTTVTVHHDHGDVARNHDLDQSYVPGAIDVDASQNASVRAYRQSIAGFLDGDHATTQRFLITRAFR